MDDLRPPWKARNWSPLDVLLSRIPQQHETGMQEHRPSDNEGKLRISNSPRRAPEITEAVQSPARSACTSVQRMDSVFNQRDHGMRTSDFFDDSSDVESAEDVRTLSANGRVPEKRRTKHNDRRSDIPYERVPPQCKGNAPGTGVRAHTSRQSLAPLPVCEETNTASTSGSSLVDSVDELLPGESDSSPPQHIHQVRHTDTDELKPSVPNSARPSGRQSSADHPLDAYAIAHDITLQALMRNKGMEGGMPSYPLAALPPTDRESVFRRTVRMSSSPRNPRSHHVSYPPTRSKERRVTLPPVDTSVTRRSLPTQFVPTPFPFSPETNQQIASSKDSIPPNTSNLIASIESVLMLSIRQSNPSSRYRMTILVIPASNELSAVRSRRPQRNERHFSALVFDDAALFRCLRHGYSALMGPWRFLSARTLQKIIISGSAMKQADRDYWIHPPRSPFVSTHRNFRDLSSEERLMQYYRKPALGISRHAFVNWGHRLAAASNTRVVQSLSRLGHVETGGTSQQLDQRGGLEFVVSWSVLRISLAIVVVMALAVAAVLLWTFLGPSLASVSAPNPGEIRDTSEAVITGVLIGICVLLLGLSGIAGWLGISWLVM